MKVVILAGGLGTRLLEETQSRPKPMVEVGGKPILAHIMQLYSHYGYDEFIVACGYKSEVIKEYFQHFSARNSDLSVDLGSGECVRHNGHLPKWRIDLINTGERTMTGGRLLRLRHLLTQTFMVTYGDGVSDVDVSALVAQHQASNMEGTLTAVAPPGRFGALEISDSRVERFIEKPTGGWINGGFFVFEPSVFRFLRDDDDVLERTLLPDLAQVRQLGAYLHQGFWHPMDTLRDKVILEDLWAGGNAPWKK